MTSIVNLSLVGFNSLDSCNKFGITVFNVNLHLTKITVITPYFPEKTFFILENSATFLILKLII